MMHTASEPDTIAGWRAVADGFLSDPCCAFHRNVEISSCYAWVHQRQPACFKWAAMAAIASHHIRLVLFPGTSSGGSGMSSPGVCITNGLPLPRDRARYDGPGQIGQPRLGGRVQQRAQDRPAQPRERPGLGFMAEDDGARAVGWGAERERVLGVQPAGVRDEGEGIRPVTGHHGAAQRDRVCLPPEAAG